MSQNISIVETDQIDEKVETARQKQIVSNLPEKGDEKCWNAFILEVYRKQL